MRKWIKIGLIASLITILTTTILVLVSKIYFNTTNNTQAPLNPPTTEQIVPETPQNDSGQIIPPSENNNESENEDSDKPTIQPNPDLPNIDETPNLPPNHVIPPNNNENTTNPNLPDKQEENKPIPPSNNEEKPTPPNQIQPEETPKPENNVTTNQFSLIKWFDKYTFIQKTTNYIDYFNNNGQLLFNENKLKNNCYELIKNCITKAMNVGSLQVILKININYQLSNNLKSVKLMIQWSLKNSGNTINFEKKYYDNIHINLKKVS